MIVENRQTFVNAVAGVCIFLFLLLQYEERRFDRGVSIEDIIKNDTFKVTKAKGIGTARLSEKTFILDDVPDIAKQNQLPGLVPRYPEIIVTGMQKCGTGALKEFLRRNPFIGYSEEGESHFFDRAQNYANGFDWYLNLQPAVNPTTKVFDKTPSYMSDPIIPERIYKYNPDAKLIFVLCEPLHRTLSHYLHAVFLSQIRDDKKLAAENKVQVDQSGAPERSFFKKMNSYNEVIQDGLDIMLEANEDLADKVNNVDREFTEYKELREVIYRFLSTPENYGSMNYAPVEIITRGAYAYHIQQYLKWFPRDQMLIINSNDLKYDPVEVLRLTQEFMGVPVAVDAKNFVVDEETGHFCILGPEDLEPRCLSSKKNRSQDHTINKNTEVKLARIYKSLKPDLDDLVGPYQFADWSYEQATKLD